MFSNCFSQNSLASAIVPNPLLVSADRSLLETIQCMSAARQSCFLPTTDERLEIDRLLQEARASCVLVVEGEELVGIFTERDAVRLMATGKALTDRTIAEVMTSSIVSLRQSELTDIFTVVNILQQHRIRHLPILDDRGRIVGLLAHECLQQLLDPIDLLRLRLVGEVMTSQVVRSSCETSVLEVNRLMVERRVSCVAIVADSSVSSNLVIPIGIVTERDLVQCHSLGLNFERTQVGAIMSTPVFTVRSDDTLWSAQSLMQEKKLQRVVVVGDRGEMLGIVTQSTLLNALNPLEIYKVVGILEQKVSRLEAENMELLQKQNIELEQRVEARTTELIAQVERERLLARMDERIRNSLNFQEILDEAVVEIRTYLNCDRVVVYQFATDLSGSIVAESVRPPYRPSLYEQINDTCFQENLGGAYREGKTFLVTDIYTAGLNQCHLELLERFQVRANLVVPILLSASHANLMTENSLWGLLVAHQCDAPRQWEIKEVELLQNLSVQLALATQQSITYDRLRLQQSQRQQIEATLKQSQQNYASLVKALPVGVFRTDFEGNCIYVNERWCQIAGLTPERAAGMGWVNGLHPDDRQLVADEWNASTEAERPFSLEYRFVNARGQITWVYGQATAERNPEGEIVGYVGSITDISDRKKSEEKVQQLLDILETAPDLIASADVSGKLTYLNQSARTLLQIDPSENISATSVPDYLSPQVAKLIFEKALPQSVQNGFWQGETSLRRRDGSTFPVWQVIVAHRQPDNSISHFSTIARDISETKRLETERKQIQEILQENAERLQLALAAANQGLYDLNVHTGEAIVNNEYATILGYEPKKFRETNASWLERLHPDDLERVTNHYLAYIAGEIPEYKVEFRQRTKTGDWKWILSLGKIVEWDAEGNPLRMLGTHTDISDRKQAEADRLQAEQFRRELKLLESILDVILAGYWDWDMTTNYEYLSPGFKRMFGYEDSELPNLPETWMNLIFPEDLPAVLACFDLHVQSRGEIPYYNEVRYRHKDGSTVWVICSGKVIEWDAEGKPLRAIGCHIDITQRKQIEAQLISLTTINQAILASASYSIISTTEDGTIKTFNKAAESMLGYAAAEVIDKATPELIHDLEQVKQRAPQLSSELGYEILPGFEVFVAKARQGIVSEQEWSYIRKDGSRFPVLLSVTALRDDRGQLTGFLGIARDITERKAFETALVESEAKFRHLVEGVNDLIWSSDRNGTLVYLSPQFQTLFGWEPSEWVGKQFIDLVHPDDRAFILQDYRENIEFGKTPNKVECRHLHRDGNYLWVRVSATLVKNSEGEAIGMQGILTDISDRKETERLLKQQLATIEAAIEGIAILKDDKYISLNHSHLSLFGYDRPEELVGKSWRQLYAPEEINRIESEVFPLLARNGYWQGEATAIRKDGTTFAEGLSLTLTEDGLLICVCRDITERKQAEAQLTRLNNALANAMEGISQLDISGRYIAVNQAYAKIGGYEPEELLGQNWQVTVHRSDLPKLEAAYQTMLEKGKVEVEARGLKKDGSLFYKQLSMILTFNEQGERIGHYCFMKDITERKQAEEKLLQTAAQLEASNRELEAFAYSVSHDLRSPLRAIDGFSQALIEDYADRFEQDGLDYFERIRNNVQRMGMLIDDLLRLSRVSRSQMQYKSVNLSLLVGEIAQDLRQSEPQRQVEWTIAPDAIVSGDPTLMRVVLTNLLHNAWKFTSHHPIANIEFGVSKEEEKTIYFVRDNGAGFDMAYADKLFGVFQRLHNTNEFPGTGIGLATVQRAILRHGGQVWAQGAIERGAIFYFSLPSNNNT